MSRLIVRRPERSVAPRSAGESGDSSDAPLLEVTDLSTTFDTPRGTVVAVDGVSLRLEKGRTLGVVGESGSGKTVLSRSIMRLLTARNVTTTGQTIPMKNKVNANTPTATTACWPVAAPAATP